MLVDWLAAFALASWLGVLLLTSGSWRTRERLEPRDADANPRRAGAFDLGRVSVLIPARNESAAIGRTLQGLAAQGRGLEVIVIDQPDDATAAAARAAVAGLRNPPGGPLDPGDPRPELPAPAGGQRLPVDNASTIRAGGRRPRQAVAS
ncbi:MAG TPA: glycosyltransferase [Gammaproteobacteria bacterium]|nr:glycosyltransferase [Gammaproteobacteria bacterium]